MTDVFTRENMLALERTCDRIKMLCDEAVEGKLMASQLMMLGSNITDFVQNPIVKNSGCV